MIDVIKDFGWTYIYAVGSDDEYGKIGLRLLQKQASENGICITGEVYIPFESIINTLSQERSLKV